jgi:hypothetical protein
VDDDYQSWTPCEMYGHRFQYDDGAEVFDSCVDCGESGDTDD